MAPAPSNSFARFGRLWRGYLRKHLWWILLASVLMVIEGSTLGLLSYMLQPMFDRVFVAGDGDAIWFVGLGIFGLFVLRAFSGVAQRVIMTKVTYQSSTAMQVDLLDHTLSLDNGFHAKTSPGKLIERVQGDVMAIQQYFNIIVTGTGRDTVALISLMAVAISIDWKWTLVAIIGAPLLLLPSLVVQRYIRRKSVYLREVASKRTTRLDEIFHGITPIKLNRMEKYQSQQFSDLSQDWVQATVKTTAGSATVPGLVDLAVGFGFFAVLIYGGPQIIAGEKTIGQFMSFFTAMALAFQPLRRLGGIAGYWQMMQASLGRIFELLDTEPSVTDLATPGTEMPAKMSIVFDNVSLAYGSLPVLNGLSFEAQPGTTTAFVGQSGAGKSTVFNVLTRLIDPQDGSVTIAGQRLSELPLDGLRDLFSVVSQDALLFDETLKENILLGRTDVSDQQLQGVLDDAHVSDFLDQLPDGLDTQVGARGSNLSGGQRQRVAIARALLRDAPILLLDEATSALDAESEKLVQKALDRLAKDRTTLIIAHRLSTIREADQIIVMDHGRAIERGTHDALIAKAGVYAGLHELQLRDGTQNTKGPNMTETDPQNSVWRPLNSREVDLHDKDNDKPFGAFFPNQLQRALIALGRRTILRRGVFRGGWTSLIFRLGRGNLDIRFRDCAYRIRGENNLIEYGLLLTPFYNRDDIDFLLEDAGEDANFVDLGSNIGLYSLPMAKSAPQGITVSIDANPIMIDRLQWNAKASDLDNLSAIHCAISDRDGAADLRIRKDDLAIVAIHETEGGEMPVRRLEAVIKDAGLKTIHGLKIDIEGHEDKALVPFLQTADPELLPKRIVIESASSTSDYPGCTEIFARLGYRLTKRTKNNSLYLLDE